MAWHNTLPFTCPFCQKDFKKERQLKSHIKDAHQEKKKDESQQTTKKLQ